MLVMEPEAAGHCGTIVENGLWVGPQRDGGRRVVAKRRGAETDQRKCQVFFSIRLMINL